jgi:hypothetical protein
VKFDCKKINATVILSSLIFGSNVAALSFYELPAFAQARKQKIDVYKTLYISYQKTEDKFT